MYLYPNTNPFRQIKGPISPHLIDRRRRRGVPPAPSPWILWNNPRLLLAVLHYTSATARGRKSTSLHLPLGLRSPSLKCASLSPVPSSTPGHVAGRGLGCRRATAIATTVSSRMSPTRMHAEVAYPGPPLAWRPGLAWEASVNAALITAARPATGIMRQLLIRICMLLRGVLYPVPASSGTGGEHFLSQGIDAPVKAERSQVTTHSNNNNASPS
jgi:hypothetical protein